MDTLMKLQNKLVEFIADNNGLFRNFEHIYLFGSIVKGCSCPHDLDFLLTYSMYKDDIISNSNSITCLLEQEFLLPVDLIILKKEELEGTNFLKKIKRYIVLK